MLIVVLNLFKVNNIGTNTTSTEIVPRQNIQYINSIQPIVLFHTETRFAMQPKLLVSL